MYKGYDSALLNWIQGEMNKFKTHKLMKLQFILIGRYIGSTEAIWRIYELPMHFQYILIILSELIFIYRVDRMFTFKKGKNVKQLTI